MSGIINTHRTRVGLEIKSFRTSLGLTQAELAERIGINQGNLARIEAGKYNITLDNLQNVADALGCDVSLIARSENLQ